MVNAVRGRSWVALALAVAALSLGFVDRAVDADLASWTGILWLVALALALSGLSFWKRLVPDVEPMPGLFQPVGAGERWCSRCGTPATGREPCGVCGHTPRPRRVKAPKVKGTKSR